MVHYAKVLILFCLGIQLSSANNVDTRDTIKIFVSIPPQKFLVEQIGGDRVSVNTMVKPGLNPETYEPTPKQMAVLNQSQLYFQIGVPFESVWIDIIEKLNRNLKIISCCENISSRQISKHNLDAHIWTSPVNAKYLANLIKTALIEHDPEYKNLYDENHAILINQLNNLDKEIHNLLEQLDNRYLIVSHPSWGYFAETYNLKQISIEQDGSEVRAKALSRLIDLAKSENINTVYIQKQVNNSSAILLAKEINARVVELDPLAENYIDNLRHVTNTIVQGAN